MSASLHSQQGVVLTREQLLALREKAEYFDGIVEADEFRAACDMALASLALTEKHA